MTNYEKYFGTPEMAAEMSAIETKELGYIVVTTTEEHPSYPIAEAFALRKDYLEWLQEECDA